MSGWYAFVVPARTPGEIVAKIHADTVTALADPATRGKLEDLALFVEGNTPTEFADMLKAERAKWEPVIKAGHHHQGLSASLARDPQGAVADAD